jgi:predicted TIM-barrel fold metal-dependent hydrolase
VPYAEGGVYADADSHLMEPGGWLIEYADPDLRDRLRPLRLGAAGRDAAEAVRSAVQRRHSATLTDEVEGDVMKAKGWHALGAFDAAERSRALDLLGFESQLVFSTFAATQFDGDDVTLLYGGTRAHNRAMVDFCAQDRRLVPVGFVPWGVPELTVAAVDEAIRLGCGAVLLPSRPARGVSPTHPDYHGVWAALADADVPFMLHVGGGGRGLHPAFHSNGKPPTTDFLGGGENIRAKDYMVIAMAPETFLSCLILDGILDEFPRLRGGCIEQGAMWVVPWLRRLDVAQASFQKTEPALRLPLRASEYVHRQLRFTPFPTEPVGWLIEQSGDDLFLFSSDYPHPEGGRDPLARFEASLEGTDDEAKQRFYAGNYADLLGSNAVLAPSMAAPSAPGDDTPGPRRERTAETAKNGWGVRSGGA